MNAFYVSLLNKSWLIASVVDYGKEWIIISEYDGKPLQDLKQGKKWSVFCL